MQEDRERYAEGEPRHHTIERRGTSSDVGDRLREDASKTEAPRAEASFETTAWVSGRPIAAYDEHHERGAEEAWRGQGPARKVNVGRVGSGLK